MNTSIRGAIAVFVSAAMLLSGCGSGESGDVGSSGPAGPPAILDCIPAGSSFCVTKSLSGSIDSAEIFLTDIGLGPMLGIGVSRPEDGKQRHSVLMAQFKKEMNLGSGLDGEGAAAAVMVNPKTAGPDFVKQIEATRMQELFALVLPGTLEKMFANEKIGKEGRLTTIGGRFSTTYAAQKGPFVIHSPFKRAVNAILDSDKSVAGELSVDQIAMISGGELTAHLNIGSCRPLIDELVEGLAGNPPANTAVRLNEAAAPAPSMYVKMAQGLIGQIDSATIGVKLGPDGLNIDSICTARPGSVAEKVFEAESEREPGSNPLDSLPSQPYVAAFGIDGWLDNPDLYDAMTEACLAMMGPDSLCKTDEKTLARLGELCRQFKGEVTGVQVVVGGAPVGKGAVGLSYVMKCRDSAKCRAVVSESVEIADKMLSGMEMPPGTPKIAMNYAANAENIGNLSIDAMEITLSGMPAGDAEDLPRLMKKLLGEEKIRLLTAAPDANTLVMNLGGSVDGLIRVLKVAGGTGPIPSDPETKLAMRSLPGKPSVVALFNVHNLTSVTRDVIEAFGAGSKTVNTVPNIECKTPVAFGLKARGATIRTTVHAPKPLIEELVQAILVAMARFGR